MQQTVKHPQVGANAPSRWQRWAEGEAKDELALIGRYRRQIMACALVLLAVAAASAVYISGQRADLRRASAAFAQALAILERPSDEERKAQARLRAEQQAQLVADEKAAVGDAAQVHDGAAEPNQPSVADRLAAQREQEREAERAADEEADRQGIPKFATARARDEAARAALLQVAERWPKRSVSHLATLQAASLAQKLGDEGQAAELSERLFAALADGDALLPLVAERVAEARRRAGDVAGAKAALGRVAGSEHRFLADEAALAQAYLDEEAGDLAEAKRALEAMSLNFPDSPLQEEMRAELASLEAQASAREATGAQETAAAASEAVKATGATDATGGDARQTAHTASAGGAPAASGAAAQAGAKKPAAAAAAKVGAKAGAKKPAAAPSAAPR